MFIGDVRKEFAQLLSVLPEILKKKSGKLVAFSFLSLPAEFIRDN